MEGVVREWAEVPYVPSRRLEKKGSQPYRYVAVRLRKLQGELFADGNSVRHARRVLLKIADRIWIVLIRAAHQRAMALSPPAA